MEAQLPFSVEGINIPEGLHNKPAATPCHLKLLVFTSTSETHDLVAFEHSKKNKTSRMAQVKTKSIYPPVHLLRDTIKTAKPSGLLGVRHHNIESCPLKYTLGGGWR